MSDLDTFRERITALYHEADPFPDGHHPTQSDLALAVGLDRSELNKRLSGKSRTSLSYDNARSIVRALAKWGVLQTQVAALDLLTLIDCPPFSTSEWQQPPLNALAPLPPSVAAQLGLPAHNLPAPLTSFVGREAELEATIGLLGQTRLLTIVGPGGMGKSRLSLELGRRLLSRVKDGVWLVTLAGVGDAGLVLHAIAAALGVREEPSRTMADTLVDWLRAKRLLLLLDNCEHLLQAAANACELLLSNCPQLIIVATSREPLDMLGETAWRLPPLALPPLPTSVSALPSEPADIVAQVSRYEAVQLFVARAAAANPDFKLTVKNAGDVVQLCVQLDGIPLAIELTAPLLRSLSVATIVQRLDDRLSLLTKGNRTAAYRHQTLRASIEWSYDLLTRAEQQLFRRLAVFQGSWDYAATEAVGEDFRSQISDYRLASVDSEGGEDGQGQPESDNPKSKIQNLKSLQALVDKSLVVLERTARGERYRMLETIRQFAAEKLAASEEQGVVGAQHAEYFLAFAEQAREGILSAAQAEWLARLPMDDANLRAAFDYWLLHKAGEASLRIGAALWYYWFIVGQHNLGREMLAATLDLGGVSPILRSKVLNGLASFAIAQTDYAQAQSYLDEAIALDRGSGNRARLASSLSSQGSLLYCMGDAHAARSLLEESIALQRGLSDMSTVHVASGNLAIVLRDMGEFESARLLLVENLADSRARQDELNTCWVLNALGSVAYLLHEYPASKSYLDECIALAQKLGKQSQLAFAYSSLGLLLIAQGELAAAREHLIQAIMLAQKLGERSNLAYDLEYMAALALAEGEGQRAATLFGAAAALRIAIASPLAYSDQQEYQHWQARLQQMLLPEALAAAWQAGEHLTLEQAISYALIINPVPTNLRLPLVPCQRDTDGLPSHREGLGVGRVTHQHLGVKVLAAIPV